MNGREVDKVEKRKKKVGDKGGKKRSEKGGGRVARK